MVNLAKIHSIIRLKLYLTVGFSLFILVSFGQISALSSLTGGIIGSVGSVAYRLIAYREYTYVEPKRLFKRHFLAEFIKMGLTLGLFALTFCLFRQVVWIALFMGYLVTATAYFLALVFEV